MDFESLFGTGGDAFLSGNESIETVRDLVKALEAGSITGRETADSSTASGAPLKVESLEKTLKTITFTENEIQLWRAIPKKAAYNTVEEYNQLSSYGNDFAGGTYLEGELPSEEDSTYIRRAQKVKYLGVTKTVSHPMMLVRTQEGVGDIIARETTNGTLFLMRKADRLLTYGNEDLIPTEFNGFYAQHEQAFPTLIDYFASDVVIDLRGARMSEVAFNRGANTIVENFGTATDFYGPPAVISGFVEEFYGSKLIAPNTVQVTAGMMGQKVNAFASQFGPINLMHDVFMNKRTSKASTAAPTSPKAPAAPTATSAVAVGSDALGSWASTDAGAYYYAVSAMNRHGESGLTVLNSGGATTVVTGGAIDLTFTATASPFPETSYLVYRSNKGASSVGAATFFPLFTVSTAQLTSGYDGGAAGKLRDRNRIMPDTNQAFLIQSNNEVFEFAQLAPLMKMDLAQLGPAKRWMILMYGTPFLYAPKKMVRYINIGRN